MSLNETFIIEAYKQSIEKRERNTQLFNDIDAVVCYFSAAIFAFDHEFQLAECIQRSTRYNLVDILFVIFNRETRVESIVRSPITQENAQIMINILYHRVCIDIAFQEMGY